MKVDVRAAFSLAPDRRVLIRDGEDTEQLAIAENLEEATLIQLGNDCFVSELGPDGRALLPLNGASVRVRLANRGEICVRRRLDVQCQELECRRP